MTCTTIIKFWRTRRLE